MSDSHNQYSRLNLKFETKPLSGAGHRLDYFDTAPSKDRLWTRLFGWSVGLLSSGAVVLLWVLYAA